MIGYLKARMAERTTWAAIGAGATAAATLPWPWNLVSFVAAAIAALVPSKPGKEPAA